MLDQLSVFIDRKSTDIKKIEKDQCLNFYRVFLIISHRIKFSDTVHEMQVRLLILMSPDSEESKV